MGVNVSNEQVIQRRVANKQSTHEASFMKIRSQFQGSNAHIFITPY